MIYFISARRSKLSEFIRILVSRFAFFALAIGIFITLPTRAANAVTPSSIEPARRASGSQTTQNVPVSLPNVSATPGLITVPITTGDTTGLGVISYDLQISFDPAIVQPASPPFDKVGTLSSGMSITANPYNPGHLIISGYLGGRLTGSGTLLNLKFNVIATTKQSTPLAFEDFTAPGNDFHTGFMFNEGDPVAAPTNGSVTMTQTCPVVSIPDLTTTSGSSATIPINTTDMTGLGAIAADFHIAYDPAVLSLMPGPDLGVTLGAVGNSNGGHTVLAHSPAPGLLNVAIYGIYEFQGSGVLVNVNFQSVIGAPGNFSEINFVPFPHVPTGFRYNEGSPCSSLTNGSVSVAPAMTGTVTYANALTPAFPRPVPDVLIRAVGTTSFSNMTDSAGNYSLSGFGPGGYRVETTKTGGQNNAISTYDCATIAQYLVGAIPFTPAQAMAADVSQNGTISSFDISNIINYIIGTSPAGSAGTWTLSPVDRTYAAVNTNITGQDYTAVLMGEVSGNWTNTGARPANGPEKSITVNAPRLVTQANSDILIPIDVEGTANKGIISYEFDLRYDPSAIQPRPVPVDIAGTISSGLSFAVNAKEPGLLRVGVYGPTPLDGNGVLLTLQFFAVGTPGSVSPLTWERIIFNEGDPSTSATDGQIEISVASMHDI